MLFFVFQIFNFFNFFYKIIIDVNKTVIKLICNIMAFEFGVASITVSLVAVVERDITEVDVSSTALVVVVVVNVVSLSSPFEVVDEDTFDDGVVAVVVGVCPEGFEFCPPVPIAPTKDIAPRPLLSK